ncbi:NAD(P)/FAD-dependent oxidoreductase [Pseudonocardia thermophila]|uniref:NAD(P)/FAD-dependent oxidoreductase n=1 Tax=Pseudonocardia thermophila TaxID=1848 RepID=UPI00248E67EE|nr:FAD-dependent oxidoreductase [Pseudonocardia thermophila]
MERIVVVGAGLAGLRAAETLRRRGFAGELTIIGDEPHRPYNRPPLSKEVLSGAQDPESCLLPSDGIEATWLLGHAATGLDLDRRVVGIGDDEVPFDGLVIASGCAARPWPGAEGIAGVHTLRGLDDVAAIRAALAGRPRTVIIGAGFIGCEVAASLAGLGADVTVVDQASRPMVPLGPVLGARAEALHRRHGVGFRLGTGVASVAAGSVTLSTGEVLAAELVLVAIGAVPNVGWLAGSGLKLAGGVECDRHCFAIGQENIVAAGDVASWQAGRGPTRIEHWTNAAEMGIAAAANLLAPPEEQVAYDPVPTMWSDQFGHRFQVAGHLADAEEFHTVVDEGDVLVLEGVAAGRLVCAAAINGGSRIAKYRRKLMAR